MSGSHKTRSLALIAVLAVAVTACGRLRSQDPATGRIAHPTGPAQLVLRVDRSGGFVPLEAALAEFPMFSLMGDGRLVTPGPQIELYPPPAVPSMMQRYLSEEAVQAVLEAAREAGLFGPDRRYPVGNVADAPTTTFTVYANGERHFISAYALGETENPGADADERAARKKLEDFQAKLGSLESWLPDGSVGPETPFEPDELRVYVLRYEHLGTIDRGLNQPPRDWPLEGPLGEFGEAMDRTPDIRCGSLGSEEMATLLEDAHQANQLTTWEDQGVRYALVLRFLLPDEPGCPE